MIHVIPVGTAEPQLFGLRNKVDGEMVAINGAGLDVELEIYAKGSETPLESPPVASWSDQDAGKVQVDGCETLAVGHYHVRFKLTDGSSKPGYSPNEGDADLWKVVAIGYRSATA